jgi:antitoxin MazE
MKTAIRKMGNSHGVIIPKPLLDELGAKANDQVEMGVENGKIIIAPIRRKARAGWAEASKRRRAKDWLKQAKAASSGRNSGMTAITI